MAWYGDSAGHSAAAKKRRGRRPKGKLFRRHESLSKAFGSKKAAMRARAEGVRTGAGIHRNYSTPKGQDRGARRSVAKVYGQKGYGGMLRDSSGRVKKKRKKR